ncbi:hypothetical protein AAFF_G00244920 [Aldrovandia affinis]|uniref:Uncharacterized protein n=1 Tax=Aldrovandia affinis TaxID=143900 RepID=A0AAD7RDD0_9TELE|nr:hypothetical protein AAFF_G00244920 [Aldrovandia affinis]
MTRPDQIGMAADRDAQQLTVARETGFHTSQQRRPSAYIFARHVSVRSAAVRPASQAQSDVDCKTGASSRSLRTAYHPAVAKLLRGGDFS